MHKAARSGSLDIILAARRSGGEFKVADSSACMHQGDRTHIPRPGTWRQIRRLYRKNKIAVFELAAYNFPRILHGSWAMIAGILVPCLASGIQAARIDLLSPFDRNCLYHLE